MRDEIEAPPFRAGPMSRSDVADAVKSGGLAHLQLAPNQSSDANQTRTQQTKRAWLWNQNVSVAANRNACRASEETMAGVKGHLDGRTHGGEATTQRTGNGSRERVAVSSIPQSCQRPSRRAVERAGKGGNAVAAGDNKTATSCETPTLRQVAGQSTRAEGQSS